MSDPQLDALILQLRGLQDLLTPLAGANQQHKLTEPIKRTIADLRERRYARRPKRNGKSSRQRWQP